VRNFQKPQPCALVIFGVTGDLTRESLMRGLYQFATRPVEDKVANRLLECITSVEADPGNGPYFDRLKEQLEPLEAARDTGGTGCFICRHRLMPSRRSCASLAVSAC
jgi:glucose-6-phosphate 1-dehydrogenase